MKRQRKADLLKMATMRFGSMCGSEWIRTERDHGISASLGELSDMQMDWLSFKIPDGVLKKAQLESAMVYRRSVINGTLNVEAESSVVRSLQKQNGMISSVYVPAAEVDEVAYGYCNGTLLPKLIGEEGARERFCLCLSEKGPNLISSILLSSGAVLMSMQFSSPIGATLFLTFHSDDWHAKPLKTTKVLDAFEHRDCKYCVARGDICECTSGVYVRACFNIREMVLRLQGVGLASPWERVRRAMTSGLSGNSTMEIGSVGSGQSPSRQAQVRFRWKATDFSDKSNADLLRVFLMKMLPPSINQDYQLTENSSSQSPDNLILDSRSVEVSLKRGQDRPTRITACKNFSFFKRLTSCFDECSRGRMRSRTREKTKRR